MEGSDGWRFGQFLTDGEEYHPNQAIMKNPVAPKCSRPIRLLDSSAQNFSRKALSLEFIFCLAVFLGRVAYWVKVL